jgi:maltooligosyltrehalose trehalohydrolase
MRGPRATLVSSCLGYNRRCFVMRAPRARVVELVLLSPGRKVVAMRWREDGNHEAVVEGIKAGARYLCRLDGPKKYSDPASRSQPDGVHGASEVVGERFAWRDEGWLGMRLEDCILYELHAGTFTPQGTFAGVIRRLRGLKELGVAAIELMPVAQFPGSRSWGYAGVYPFAVQSSYGGPGGLKRLGEG